MQLLRTRLLLALCFLCAPFHANAQCGGAVMLAGLHDAYLATLTETGETQIRGATTLLVVVGGKNADALSRQAKKAGIDVPQDRLRDVMQSGVKLAQSVLSGLPLPSDLFPHSRNIDWLNSIAHRANCQNAIRSKAKIRSVPEGAVRSWDFADKSFQKLFLIEAAVAVVFLALTGFGIRTFLKSRTYRTYITQRLPRRPISVEFPITFTDPDGNMQQTEVRGLDISAGGMKLDWPDNGAPPGTTLTISMPFGERLASVMWSNAYFAGIMFDETLVKVELAQLETAHSETKTAPESAASKARV